MSFGIIYKATNLVNGKIYIGQTTKDPVKYWIGHLKFAYKSKNSKKVFYRAIQKHGPESFLFETIEFCDSKEELDEMEFHYIKQYNSFDRENGYNMTLGGEGFTGKHTEETKKKISINSKIIWSNETHKKIISNSMKNLWKSIDYRKNIEIKSKITKSKNKERHSYTAKISWNDETIRNKRIASISRSQKILWKDKKYRKNQTKSISNANRNLWKNEEYRNKTIEAMKHQAWKEIDIIKIYMQNGLKQKEIANLLNCSAALISKIVKEIKFSQAINSF